MGAVLGFEYAPEYAELVRRVFHGDAPGGVVPAGIILAADRAEWAILRGEINWQLVAGTVLLAANFSGVAVRQPAPNRLTVVEEIWINNFNAAAQTYRMAQSYSLPTPITTIKSLARDDRRGTGFQPSTTASTYQDPTGFLLAPASTLIVPPNSVLQLKPRGGFVVHPSLSNIVPANNLILQGHVVNQECGAYFFGYERGIKPEEKFDS